MVIGMGVSILIARRGQGYCPLHLNNHLQLPTWDSVKCNPYIPLSSQVNKWNGIPVKRAEK
jgi:hypothetical protein